LALDFAQRESARPGLFIRRRRLVPNPARLTFNVRQREPARMKYLCLFCALFCTVLIFVVLIQVGITRPKSLAGGVIWAGAFWFYYWSYRKSDLAKEKKKDKDLRPRDWMGNPLD
jgi:hypothetical protein